MLLLQLTSATFVYLQCYYRYHFMSSASANRSDWHSTGFVRSNCNWKTKFCSQRTSHMEPSATSNTVTGPVGERLQAGTEDAPALDRPATLRRLHDSRAGHKYSDLLTYLLLLYTAYRGIINQSICPYQQQTDTMSSSSSVLTSCAARWTPQYAPALWPWPFDLEVGVGVACDLGYPCAKFRLPRPFGFRVRADVRDIRQMDGLFIYLSLFYWF